MVESNRLLIYRAIYCTQGSNPCFSFVNKSRIERLTFDRISIIISVVIQDIIGIVVQLVRAPPCHGGSCEFESRQSRFKSSLENLWIVKCTNDFHEKPLNLNCFQSLWNQP